MLAPKLCGGWLRSSGNFSKRETSFRFSLGRRSGGSVWLEGIRELSVVATKARATGELRLVGFLWPWVDSVTHLEGL